MEGRTLRVRGCVLGTCFKASSLADLVLSVSVGLMSQSQRDSQSLMFVELEAHLFCYISCLDKQ